MPPHLHADRPAPQPPDRGALDALIAQARRLRGGLDAVRREAAGADGDPVDAAEARWQRALCDLAAHQLDDLGGHLDQLRSGPAGVGDRAGGGDGKAADGAPPALGPSPTSLPPGTPAGAAVPPVREGAASDVPAAPRALPPGRAGTAEWDLLTDEVSWSDRLYEIFGRTAGDGALSLDELPSWVPPEDQPGLMGAVTDCLVDARPIDHEFRIVRPDGELRAVHLLGEPLLDDAGGTAAMWAVVRDISELRREELAVRESRETLHHERRLARTQHRLAVELQESVLPPWRGPMRRPGVGPPAAAADLPGSAAAPDAPGTLDIASHYLPSATSALIGGDWYDATELPDGATLLSAGDLTGHGVAATSGMAMLLGAVRGMAIAGVLPGALMGHLNELLDSAAQPALGSAVCCRYAPDGRTLTWAQSGHPAPLLFRAGTGRALEPPDGVLLGATSGARYGQATEELLPGDVLVLHTDGLAPRAAQLPEAGPVPDTGAGRLLSLAPRLTAARTAQECVRAVVEEFGDQERDDDACVLVARVTG